MALVASFIVIYAVYCDKLLTGVNLRKMLTKSQKNGQNHEEKRAKKGQFSQNSCLNRHSRFKTGDFSTLGLV